MWVIFLTSIIVFIDQLLKHIVIANVKSTDGINIIPDLLDITYVENKGAAFGIMQNHRWFFIAFAFIMISVFIYLIAYRKMKDKMFIIASILIIGGGIGNIIDRLILGYVVDYIKISFFPPVCNFADYCVTIGTVILIIYVLFFYKEKEVISQENKSN